MTTLSISESSVNSHINEDQEIFEKGSKSFDEFKTAQPLYKNQIPKAIKHPEKEKEDSISYSGNANDSQNDA